MAVVMTDPKVVATRFNDTFNAHDETTIKGLVSPNIRFTAPAAYVSSAKTPSPATTPVG